MPSGGITKVKSSAVIIGGGITGLTAAYRLLEKARQERLPLDVTVLEKNERLGGVIKTANLSGCLIEQGPDAILTAKPWALKLIDELGLAPSLVSTSKQHRRAFIAREGTLFPLPEGFRLIAPGDLGALLLSPLFSVTGKLRMLMDLFLPRHARMIHGSMPDDFDESLAGFVRRRLGREALERVAQPILGGIYTADPERLSLRATMPQFHEWECRYGSVIKGVQRLSDSQSEGAVRYGMFVSLKGGLSRLIERLAERIGDERIKLGVSVKDLSAKDGWWRISFEGGGYIDADIVVLAVPAVQAARLSRSVSPPVASLLERVHYASSAVVNLIFDRRLIGHPLDGFGFVVPESEGLLTIACSFASVKFEDRAPAGKTILRAFVGGAGREADLDRSDTAIVRQVLQDLDRFLGLKGHPESTVVTRWPESMPQYDVGHLNLVAEIERMSQNLHGLYITGNGLKGVGIPDCVRSAEQVAAAAFERVKSASEMASKEQ